MLDLPLPTTRFRLMVHGIPVTIRPMTVLEVNAVALRNFPGITVGVFVIAELDMPSFPDTPEGEEQQKTWWAALEKAAETCRQRIEPVLDVGPSSVDKLEAAVGDLLGEGWEERLAPLAGAFAKMKEGR